MISIWEKESFYRPTDVLIAGGGLMGLWTAWELKGRFPTLEVTVAEAQSIPAIASTRNAGFACFGSPSEMWSDMQHLGSDTVYALFEMRYKGILKIKSVLGQENIGYVGCGGYEVYNQPEWTGDALFERLQELNKNLHGITGLEATFCKVDDEMAAQGLRGFTGMVYNPLEGGLHSGKLVQGLYDRLVAKGVRFLFGHRVEHIHYEAGGLQAGLVTGLKRLVSVSCKRVLWATNAGLGKMFPFTNTIEPARGQVLVSPPVNGLSLNGTFHFDEGYYYFRNYGNRLLLGGARNKAFQEEATDQMEPTPFIREQLEAFIANHLPQVATCLNAPGWLSWAGIMGKSKDNLPFVQEVSAGVYAAFACNGMGVALTPIMAEKAAEQLTASFG